MSFDEYLTKFSELLNERKMADVNELQYTFMRKQLQEYKDKSHLDNDPSVPAVIGIIEYLINHSQSGSVVWYAPTESLCGEIEEELVANFGDMLLDNPQTYHTKSGLWALDCVFGGAFCPDWDGFEYGIERK